MARVRTRKPGKGKTREGQPEEDPEKKGRAAALKQRLAAIKEKRTKKQQTDETDPAEKQSKKEKAQKAAGIVLFPVILILGIPILIGKGIASGFRKVRDRKTKTDGDVEDPEQQQQQQQQAKTGRRVAMKHRLSERSGSMKQGLSTRSDAIKKRLVERKAKKADADGATTTAAPDGPTNTAGQGDGAGATTQERKTKKQRLTGLLIAGPLAVKKTVEKKRQGKDKPTKTAAEDATPKEKASRFAGAKERVRALRTKVNKQARFAKLKARLRVLQERRKTRKNVKKSATSDDNDTAPVAEVDDSNNERSVKKHGAIAGLVAGCVALPAAKVKQARDRRRKGRAADGVEGAAAAARDEHATANSSSVAPAAATVSDARESASSASRPSGVRLVPSEPDIAEPAADHFSPPENGQSEVPIQQAARTEPDLVPGSSDGGADVATASAAAPGDGEDHSERPAAAVRFKSIRDGFGNVKGGIGSGITNLKARRRGAGQSEVPVAEEAHRPQAETMDSAETHVEANPSTVEPIAQPTAAEQNADPAASGGRFKSIKGGIGSGIEGLKARRQREKKEVPPQSEGAAATAATETEKRTAADGDPASSGGRLKALKDGLGSRRAKSGENGTSGPVKPEKSKQQKQEPHKDWNSGLVDRMRWFLYAA